MNEATHICRFCDSGIERSQLDPSRTLCPKCGLSTEGQQICWCRFRWYKAPRQVAMCLPFRAIEGRPDLVAAFNRLGFEVPRNLEGVGAVLVDDYQKATSIRKIA